MKLCDLLNVLLLFIYVYIFKLIYLFFDKFENIRFFAEVVNKPIFVLNLLALSAPQDVCNVTLSLW